MIVWITIVNLTFIPVFKPHTHKLYFLRHCTNIVYSCLPKPYSTQSLSVYKTPFQINSIQRVMNTQQKLCQTDYNVLTCQPQHH